MAAGSEPEDLRFLDDLSHIVWIVKPNSSAHYLNRYGREFLGLTAEEADVQAWLGLVHPEDAARVQELWEVTHSGSPYEVEYRLKRADGEYRWVVERGVPQRGPDGQILRWVGTCTDIEEQKRTLLALRESEERYRRLSDNSLNGLALCELVTDGAGRAVDFVYLEVNGAFERLTGLAAADVLGQRATRVIPGIEETDLIETYGRVVASGVPTRFELGIPGLKRFYEVMAVPTGGPHFAAIFSDLTPRKLAESALHQEKALSETLFTSLPGMVYVIDRNGRLVRWNHEYSAVLGRSTDDLQGADALRPIVAEDKPGIALRIQRLFEHGGFDQTEARVLNAVGEVRHYILSAQLIELGGQPFIVGTGLDVTARRRAEEKEARLSQVVEQSAESIVMTDPLGTIIYVNPAFERVTGYSRAEAIGQNPRMLKSGHQDATFYRRMWEALARGEVWQGRLLNRRKDGSLFEEDATIGPVRDATGRTVNYVAVKRDVTNETRLERELLQAQKMEAVGRLAGGVAHDFNNMLGVITGYAQITQRRLAPDDPLQGKLEQIVRAADRAASLTRQLLAFSRQQVMQPKVLDLNAIVSDMEKMLRRLIGEDVALRTTLAPGLGSVKADPGQLEQVIMNLAVNARDAMPEGGRLTIETRNVDVGSDEVSHRQPAGRYVLLTIADSGTGMNAETQSHIFEPFFTTKEVGKGTGLGLSTVYGIVKQSEGYIWVESEVGVGTTFKIYLPRLDEEAAPLHKAAPVVLTRGQETILLIEDEPSLREVLCEILEGAGYALLVARDGAEALRLAEQYAGPIHLTVTDVIMPGMTGRETMDRMAPTRPEMKILYVSGYTDEAIAKHGVLTPGTAFMGKPFTTDELLAKVRETLDQR